MILLYRTGTHLKNKRSKRSKQKTRQEAHHLLIRSRVTGRETARLDQRVEEKKSSALADLSFEIYCPSLSADADGDGDADAEDSIK